MHEPTVQAMKNLSMQKCVKSWMSNLGSTQTEIIFFIFLGGHLKSSESSPSSLESSELVKEVQSPK